MSLTRREVLATGTALLASTVLPDVALAADKVVITPSMTFIERQTRIVEENTYTIVYEVMERWNFTKNTYERAPVGSPQYAGWLADYKPAHGIPPHIQFGGAVVAGKGDPTFHDRWVARTKAALARGDLV